MIRPDQGAFPILHSEGKWAPGLSKREYMATQICAGLCADNEYMNAMLRDVGFGDLTVADIAVRVADNLITALNREPQP